MQLAQVFAMHYFIVTMLSMSSIYLYSSRLIHMGNPISNTKQNKH